MRLRPRTVRRIARRSRRKALELRWLTRAREWLDAASSHLGRAPVVLVAPPVVGIAGLFLPTCLTFSFAAIDRPAEAKGFLTTLWQVEGGTIALSLSLILVAFETIWRGRFRGSVRRFADEVFLLYAVSLAFTSLLVIGCTLLGWGTGAPGGWAASWSTILSAAAFGAVPIILVRTLLLMNPASAHQRRLDQIRAEVHDAVDAEAFERLAYGELKLLAERSPGLSFAPMLIWEPSQGRTRVEATKAGVVHEIRIGRLARIAKKLRTGDTAALTIGVYVGMYVPRGGDLAVITDDASWWRRWRTRRAFVIDTRSTRSRLYDVIAHINQEALQAIREVQPSTYDDLAALWVELLIRFPEAWRRYGHPFDETVAGEFSRFGLGPVDAVARNLYIEAREATKSMHDIAAKAFGLPDLVMTRILDIDAPALLIRMLALYVELYPTAAELPDVKLRDRLLHLVFELPAQYGRRVEHDFRNHELPIAEHQRADRNLHMVFRTLMEQMKAVADHDPSQAERVGKINSSWAEIFQGWFPEHDKEDIWPGLTPEDQQRRRDHNAEIDRVIVAKDALDDLRNAYRFAVSYWALHQLRETGYSDWLKILNTILPWLGPPDRLAKEADQVAQIDLDERIFLGWHGHAVQMGWAAPRAFVIFTLLQHSPNAIPSDVGRRNFLRGGMLAEIEQMLDNVAADAPLWQLLGGAPADLAARVTALREALQASAVLP
jgi:hypothetical protein